MCLAVHLRFQIYRPAIPAFVGAHFRFHHHHHLHSFIVKSKISHFKIGEIRFILIQFILFFIQEYLSFVVPFCRMTFKLVYRSQFAVANPKIQRKVYAFCVSFPYFNLMLRFSFVNFVYLFFFFVCKQIFFNDKLCFAHFFFSGFVPYCVALSLKPILMRPSYA